MDNIDIISIEDDADFCFLMQKAFYQIDKNLVVKFIENGPQALAALQSYAARGAKLKLILLDLNLPGMSGLETLLEIKGIKTVSEIPVIIFTTSEDARDQQTAIQFGASDYVSKPLGYANLIAGLRKVHADWFS